MSAQLDQVAAFFDRFCTAWQSNDGDAVAALFTGDGSLVNPFGQRADGRSAVAAMYGDYFRGMLAGTSTTFRLDTVRAVEGDHAFADGEQTIHGADGAVVLTAHLATLLRRDGESWQFVDSRPYSFAGVPG